MAKKNIYLDYAATTPIDPEVLRAMTPFFKEKFGNPSSIHSLGEEARIAVDSARKKTADFFDCGQNEVIFTGSATESNNLAIKGLVLSFLNNNSPQLKNPHIVTSMIEHHSVLEPFAQLEKMGVEATYLPVNRSGEIQVSELAKVIKENTVLVSIMYANNEMGAVQPISQIGNLLKEINQVREKDGLPKIYFHTDASQAINWLNCDVNGLGVDLFTVCSHKFYGPKGIGALYIKKETPINPQIKGGGQEYGIRSSTENVASIVGLAKALEQAKKNKKNVKKILKLRDKLIQGVLKSIPEAEMNSSIKNCLPNIANFSFKGAEGEAIILALDQEGILASTGSACASRSLEPSHVLLALGLDDEEAHASVRFSLGRYTTERDINYVLKILPGIVERLREISGYK